LIISKLICVCSHLYLQPWWTLWPFWKKCVAFFSIALECWFCLCRF